MEATMDASFGAHSGYSETCSERALDELHAGHGDIMRVKSFATPGG